MGAYASPQPSPAATKRYPQNDDFCIYSVFKMIDFASKMMDFALKMIDFAFKMMDFALKMMHFGRRRPDLFRSAMLSQLWYKC